jgi:hypothetical protein
MPSVIAASHDDERNQLLSDIHLQRVGQMGSPYWECGWLQMLQRFYIAVNLR